MPRSGERSGRTSRTGATRAKPRVAGRWTRSASGRGRATWPDDPRYDPELLEHGDRRNVVDRYRYWRREAVVADLDPRRHDFHVAVENWQHDFNIGSVVRTANAFLAREVHVVGRRRWNRRGAMVTDRYQHVRHHADVESLAAWAAAESLPVVGVDNLPGSVPLESTRLPRACVLLFGQEGPGLSAAARAPSRSSCRSRSSARPGRSTPARPPRSPCTPGSASTSPATPSDPSPFDHVWQAQVLARHLRRSAAHCHTWSAAGNAVARAGRQS